MTRTTHQEPNTHTLSNMNKAVKKTLKIGAITLASILGVIIVIFLLLSWTVFSSNRLTKTANQVIDKYLPCNAEVNKVGLSLVSSYPFLAFEFYGLTVFDEMEENVDKYLDWYYSLDREYSELYTYVIGIIEDQVEEKAVEFINKHLTEKLSPNYDLDTKLEKIINYNKKDIASQVTKVVITGGPSSGKTECIYEVKNHFEK